VDIERHNYEQIDMLCYLAQEIGSVHWDGYIWGRDVAEGEVETRAVRRKIVELYRSGE